MLIRSDTYSSRSCEMCAHPTQGEGWRKSWGCTGLAERPLYLGSDVVTHRCPIALLRESASPWPEWAAWAAGAWDTGNLATVAGGAELSAAGWDALRIGLSASRDREAAEWERKSEEAGGGESTGTVRRRGQGHRRR